MRMLLNRWRGQFLLDQKNWQGFISKTGKNTKTILRVIKVQINSFKAVFCIQNRQKYT